ALPILLEPVAPGNRHADTLAAIERGEMVARRLDHTSGAVDLLGDVPDSAVVFDGRTLVSAFGPRLRMLIIGAGQLSRYLAEFALALDYQVTIC
ncbi:hypothetical protein LLG90_28155, partial [Aromatoleum toluclasticum]|nr:hypothetical protein [Aromatoleum toluclasticum]